MSAVSDEQFDARREFAERRNVQRRVAVCVGAVDVSAVLYQQADALAAARPLDDGAVQGRAAARVDAVGVGAALQQQLERLGRLRKRGEVRRRLLAAVARVRVGAGVQQHARAVGVAVLGRQMQRRRLPRSNLKFEFKH